MRIFKVHLLTAFILGLGLAFLVVPTALAWVKSGQWGKNNATYGYGGTYPAGEWRQRVGNAAQTWNSVSTSSWWWTESLIGPEGLLNYYGIDGPGNVLAGTTPSLCGSNYCGFQMTVDSAETWYTGTGTPSSSQNDLLSLLVHEFGHALGLGHTNVSCSGTSRPTMCAGWPGGGLTFWRSLESDDQTGVSSLYP